jgi:putative inorganic carbon (hco3(-)) transporter
MTDAVRSETRDVRVLALRRLPATSNIRSTNIQMLLSQVVFAVLLTRSFSDPIFGLSGADMGGSTIGVGALVNALVIGVAIAFVFVRPRAVPFAAFAMWAPFILAVIGATLYAPNVLSAARLSFVILSYWAMFTLPFFMFRTADDLPRFVLIVLASSIVPTLYSLWEVRLALSDSEFRLQSTFTHPNIFAFYLVLQLGLALYVRTASAVRWPSGVRTMVGLYIPVLLVMVALTQTRSAYATCAFMFVVYAALVDRRWLAAIVVAPILLSAHTLVGERIASLSQGDDIEDLKKLNADNRLNSYAWRKVLWESSLEPAMQTPVLGHGLDSFRPSTIEFFPLAPENGIDAHNWYLQIFFDMGLVGLLAYAWLQGSLLRWLKKGYDLDRRGYIVAFCIVGAYLLESYSDNMIYYLAFNWYYMFIIGTFCAWVEYRRSSLEGLASRRPSRFPPQRFPPQRRQGAAGDPA